MTTKGVDCRWTQTAAAHTWARWSCEPHPLCRREALAWVPSCVPYVPCVPCVCVCFVCFVCFVLCPPCWICGGACHEDKEPGTVLESCSSSSGSLYIV